MKKWRTVCRLLLVGWLVGERGERGEGMRMAGGLTASWPRHAHSFSRIQRVRIHFSPLPTASAACMELMSSEPLGSRDQNIIARPCLG